MTPEDAFAIPLPTATTRLPTGATVALLNGRVELGATGPPVLVNDVAVHGGAALRSGDLVSQADHLYVVLPDAQVAPSSRTLLDHGVWMRRVDEELEAGERGFAVLLGRSGAFLPEVLPALLERLGGRLPAAAFGRDAVELLVPEASRAESVRAALTLEAQGLGETARWGLAQWPRDGATSGELWSVAVDRLLGLESPGPADVVWTDPGMARLRALADRWSTRRVLRVVGEPGVGRETLVRCIRLQAAPEAPFVVHRAPRFDAQRWAEDVARASGGALHVRYPDALPDPERRALRGATTFRPSESGASPGPRGDGVSEVLVPALAERPQDVVTIAESVLHAVDSRLARRRSSLRVEASALLAAQAGVENVRGLRNAVIRAALTTTGAELRPDHLDAPDVAAEPEQGVRAKVRDTERRAIETALQRTGWNVTEAARRMKLPRRTLVYRMSRLGLRRPGRAG